MHNVLIKNSLLFLLLSVFLTTNVGHAAGYTWCLGDDGHSKIEQASLNGCADRKAGCSSNLCYAAEDLSDFEAKHCSPCSDLLLESNNAVVAKRVIKDVKVVLKSKSRTVSPFFSYNQKNSLKYTSQAPRVSQAILALRTVILLS